MEEAESTFWSKIVDILNYGYNTYKDFVFGLFIGMFVGWIYHRILGGYSLRKSNEKLLQAKDETIAAYRELISNKLDNMDSLQYDKNFFKRLKKYFRKTNS